MNNDGAKIPPDPPEPIVSDTATIFTITRMSSSLQPRSPVRRFVDRLIADAEDLRETDRDHPMSTPPIARFEDRGKADLVEEIFGAIQGPNEEQGNESSDNPECAICEELICADEAIGRNLERREIAEEVPADHGRRDRGNHNRGKLGDAEIAENDLDRKQGASHRRIEGGGDPGRGAATDKSPQPAFADPQPLADRRTDRRTDLNDRSFPTHRSS